MRGISPPRGRDVVIRNRWLRGRIFGDMSRRRATRLQYDAAPVAILLLLSVAAWLVSSHLAEDEMRMGLLTGMDDGSMEGSDATGMAMSFPFFMASWVT